MGKLVTVKNGFSYVLLPNRSGDGSANFKSGDQVTVTDAEYAAFNAATLQAITLTTSGLPDPARKASDPKAGSYATASFTTAAGGTIPVGTTTQVTGPAGGVTYNTGFLTVAADSPGTGVVGPKSGSVSTVTLLHKQGVTASVAPTNKNWFASGSTVWPGGTVPTFTASANALDLFRFETLDGGQTWVNILTVKGLA